MPRNRIITRKPTRREAGSGNILRKEEEDKDEDDDGHDYDCDEVCKKGSLLSDSSALKWMEGIIREQQGLQAREQRRRRDTTA